MSINELPDDCLLIIFGLINELDDLLNCYKVCSKWSQLIAKRTRTVKYLIANIYGQSMQLPRNVFGYVYYKTEAPIDGTCLSTLFPNLRIADFSSLREKVKYEDMVTLVKEIKPLKGLIHYKGTRGALIWQYCDQLEMLSTNYIDPCMEKNGVNIKQLRLGNVTLDEFKTHANYFPNLERLHINTTFNKDGYYDGPIFSRLKIFEMPLSSSYKPRMINYGFQFMDSCPNLQSAHIYLMTPNFFVDESIKHESLQDLVITFYYDYENFNWNDWQRLFTKYPNLKHLAISRVKDLENEHVEQLVRILTNLVLFAVRGCGVTQKAADYVQGFNKLHGRSIKFYFDENYHEIQSDWPQLSTEWEKISQGFDFMKNCFLKDFRLLPTFLISNEA
uniref:F-box domain-containing protein n=1 Tax=Tetranychus urticae TaxID=32264 RepID=T1JRU0_TETUR